MSSVEALISDKKTKMPLSNRFKKAGRFENALFLRAATMIAFLKNDHSIEDCDYDRSPQK